MTTTEKLTQILQGRKVGGGAGASGLFAFGFEGGSSIRVEIRGVVSEMSSAMGRVVREVRQQGATLVLAFTDGHTLEMELAEAGSVVVVRDGNGVLAYAGGVEPESWCLVTHADYAEAVREAREREWRDSFEGSMQLVEAWIGYLLDPEVLQRRPPRRKRPRERTWLTVTLKALRSAGHKLRLGGEIGAATAEDGQRRQRAREIAQQGARENLALVKEHMQRDLAGFVASYSSPTWIAAIEAGVPHEFWHLLSQRDSIQVHIEAPEWLHPDLAPDPRLLQVVTETDARLRVEGARLWQMDPPAPEDVEFRARFHPSDDWWWWLDQAGKSDDTASA
jgi:hypothetical protein